MRLHFASIASFLVAGCVRLDPDHCANQGDPSAYCQDRYCSACESANNGCMDAEPGPECNAGGPVAETGDATTTATTDVTMSASMSSTTIDTMTMTEPTTTMSTTESMDSSTTEYIEPGCGNGVFEQGFDTNCDGMDLPAEDCSDVGLSPAPGTDGKLGCYPGDHPLECTYDLTECMGASQCGNSEIEGTEQCDMEMLADQTCESLNDDYIGGTLTCTGMLDPNPCTFNTSQCELCRPGGEECTQDGQCCTGNCVTLLMANECSAL